MDAPIRVLIVEDNDETGEALSLVLRLDGFIVYWAHSGAEALKYASAAPGREPDVVLLDLMLPDGDGVDVALQLQRSGDHTPVILHSAASEWVIRGAAERANAAAWLRKPVDCGVLRETLRTVVEPSRNGR